jgi:hypothetical protein
MSEATANPSISYETQRQRWLKYGANVALTVIVAIVLAVLLVYLAQQFRRRVDSTQGRIYSLKPQTINLVKDLKNPVTLVSLYSQSRDPRPDIQRERREQAQTVQDLLFEYQRKSNKIDVQIIDPDASPAKGDALIKDVTERYGGEVQKYRAFLDEYGNTFKQLKTSLAEQGAALKALATDSLPDRDLAERVDAVQNTLVSTMPQDMDARDRAVTRKLALKPPDYVGAVTSVQTSMEEVGERVGQVVAFIKKLQDEKGLPDPMRKTLADRIPALESIKKTAEDLGGKSKNLGDIKLDALRESLAERNVILVMGKSEMRAIPHEQVWKLDEQALKNFIADAKNLQPRFAGEQAVTTAIFAVSQPSKTRVVFVRPGGSPLTPAGFPPFQPSGPMSQVAERLRGYGFEVLEKDISGTYAMQAQMRGMPPEPEASDEQMKGAIWVVLAAPGPGGPMGPGPSTIGPKVAEHLKNGGSALLIAFPQEDSLPGVLAPYGIDVRTDAIAVHEGRPIDASATTGDPVEDLRRLPFVFDIRDYGDHELTKPLRSLESLLLPLMVVKTTAPKGEASSVTPIIPIPDAPAAPKSWGETDMSGLQRGDMPRFDDKTDIPGPIFGGAVAELKNGGRLVLLTSARFAYNSTLDEPDPELARKRILASRFPGNSELFSNSMFWLAKMETMIAISPATMDVARVQPMSEAALNAWHIGVLLVGLPGLVILAGIAMFVARRD